MAKLAEAEPITAQQSSSEIYGELTVSGRFKAKLAELFEGGTFSPDTQAILEFVDNAVAARNRETGSTRVLVSVSPDRLRVVAFDEKGMDAQGILGVFRMGETGLAEDEIGLNTKGAGLKLATFRLAKHLEYLRAKLPDSDRQHVTSLMGLGDENIDFKGNLTVITEEALEAYKGIGVVDIGLRGMKWDKPPAPTQLARDLGITYAPILVEDDGKWTHQTVSEKGRTRKLLEADGAFKKQRDKIQIFVHSASAKSTIQAKPPEVCYRADIPGIEAVVRTSENEPLGVRAGVLDLTKMSTAERRRDKPAGGHLIYDGRVVERQVYPPAQEIRDTRVRDRLRFDVDITHVKGIKDKLQMNKSDGVRKGPERDRILAAVEPTLIPLVEAIKSLETPSAGIGSSHFRDQLNLGRKFADAALRKMFESGEFEVDEALIGAVLAGIRPGQERPSSGEEGKARENQDISGVTWKKQAARTLPTKNADPAIPRRRLTPYHIRARALDDQVTSAITVEGGKAFLDINETHPLSQFHEIIDGLDPSAGSLAAAILGATEEARHLARELSGGDPERAAQVEQALLWISGQMLTEEPEWKFLEDRSRQALVQRQKKKK